MSLIAHATTAEELLALPRGQWRYELVDGELRRMSPAGAEHGRVAMKIGARLELFVSQHKLGAVYAAETGFLLRRNPDTVRAPDAAFVAKTRQSTAEGYFPGAPDLAVEVISPSDSFVEVEEKVIEWLAAGTQAVVVVNPRQRAVSVYRSKTDIRLLGESDTLDLSFVVPGFSVEIRQLFE